MQKEREIGDTKKDILSFNKTKDSLQSIFSKVQIHVFSSISEAYNK